MPRLSALVLCAAILALAASATAGEATLGTDAGAGPRLDADTHIPMGPIFLTSFSAVAIAIGAGLGWQADQYDDQWKKARDAGDPYNEMGDLSDDVQSHAIAADVLMFGGAAGAVIGIVWWIVAAKHDKAERGGSRTAYFRPILGPAQAGAAVEF
jgi:hypothetical protein